MSAKRTTTLEPFIVTVPQTPGRCRWCRCTHTTPCAGGCSWADRQQTLCTECVPLDLAMKSQEGRRLLARLTQNDPDVNIDDFREAIR